MGKHTSFWIGFFAAALLIVPIAVGIWGLAGDFARDMAVFVFGAVVAMVLLLIVTLFLRDRILLRLIGRSEASIEELSRSVVSVVSALGTGDISRAEAEATKLAATATNWYAWSNFYRWVIATTLGLLLAFGAFTGTVLLFEQTKKLGEQTELMSSQTNLMTAQTERLIEQNQQLVLQNEISALSITSSLRERLRNASFSGSWADVSSRYGSIPYKKPAFYDESESCGILVNQATGMASSPNESEVLDIARVLDGRSDASRILSESLEALMSDVDDQIALAALMILDRADHSVSKKDFFFSGIYSESLTLKGQYNLHFFGSVFEEIVCEKCTISFDAAILYEASAAEINLRDVLLRGNVLRSSGISSNVLTERYPNTVGENTAIELVKGPSVSDTSPDDSMQAYFFSQNAENSACSYFEEMSNGFFEYYEKEG